MHGDVVLIQFLPWQAQELVFILPAQRLLLEFVGFLWWKRRLGDFGDEVGGGCFGEAVDEDADEGDLDEGKEGEAEAEEDAGAVFEPDLLLFAGVADAAEVGLELECVREECQIWGRRICSPIHASEYEKRSTSGET